MRVVRRGICSAFPQLTGRTFANALVASAALFLIAASPAPQTQTPKPAATPLNLTKMQPKALLPKVPLHTEWMVTTNKYGQVTGSKAIALSKNNFFNMQTYGNSLQAYIRTTNDRSIPGTYRLMYQYDPSTARVHRDVALIKAGGVDVNEEGAALIMVDRMKKQEAAARAKALKAHPLASASPGHG